MNGTTTNIASFVPTDEYNEQFHAEKNAAFLYIFEKKMKLFNRTILQGFLAALYYVYCLCVCGLVSQWWIITNRQREKSVQQKWQKCQKKKKREIEKKREQTNRKYIK